MVKSKSNSNSNKSKKPEDVELIKSDVAAFASLIGLSNSQPDSGFNDVDFRSAKPNKPPKKHQTPEQVVPQSSQNPKNKTLGKNNGPHDKRNPKPEPKPKPPVLSLENDSNKEKGFNKFRNLPKLPLMKANGLGVWFEDMAELEGKVVGEGKKVEVKNVGEWKGFVEKKRELGERLMAQYALDYESSRGQSSDIKMLVSTQRSGTAADKVSAFSVLVGDNPIANLRSLDALLGMVTSKVGKRHALTGFEALQELFIASLLPDRKLKTLIQRPLNHIPDTKDGYSLLLFWYWEECLKQRYERFVVALEEASRDMLPALKTKALKAIYVLLSRKSEQECRLLSALVNKLGDPDNKAASNADYHLSNLLSDHPNMKAVVIDEVDSFLFRPHLGPRSQYHAINFLSQIRHTNKGEGPKVAKRLIDVYFALFKVLITGASSNQKKFDKSGKANPKEEKSKELSESPVELDSRLLSALLTGVNRAFPFVSSNEADDIVDVQTPVLFQLVHSKNFNVGVQALMLLDKISSKNQIASDRYYRALYSKLLLPAAMNTSKAEMFIALLLRAMKRDVNLKRVAAFSKRLLQIALQQPPQYGCACLFLLSELLKARPPLWNVVLQNEAVDEELEHFEDVIETDNAPSTVSNKQNNDVEVVHNGEDANANTSSSESEDDLPASSEDDDDSDDGASEDGFFLLEKNETDHKKSKSVSDNEGHQSQLSAKKSTLPGGYDPRLREPSYCNADRVSWWELMVLASHAHPSVATMARTLLSGANIVYNGNPLNDLSLTAFLDKFMEKKPKQSTWHGGSQIEPAKQMDVNNQLIGAEILSLAEADVPPEDLVFHKFYTNKMSSTSKPKKKKKKSADEEAAEELFDIDDDGEVDGGDESDNEEIENLLDSADPSLGADSDYDYDDLDKVADEEDEDLIGDDYDAEIDIPSDMEEDEADVPIDDDVVGSDDDDIEVGDFDDASDGDVEEVVKRKRKHKSGGKSGVSPFASYEEFEHLMEDDDHTDKKPTKKNKSDNEPTKKNKSKKRKK
ncbi:CCAAT/enhancer-binding protein zeta [Cajanus cajan]|uniref:CCAAT/enhancer-binding protein zeta n=1 Tax=Cajanus cajan TaxID=3821 RepID=UPI00098D7E40|nr:CCAAT/enhancer-binding protein zeta [Cajanus cajan]